MCITGNKNTRGKDPYLWLGILLGQDGFLWVQKVVLSSCFRRIKPSDEAGVGLFHALKPSRHSAVLVMALLRKDCRCQQQS